VADTTPNPRKVYIDAKIKAGTTKTRAELGQEYDEQQSRKATTTANPSDLKAKVERYFPGYAFLLDPSGSFGSDVAQVLADAVAQSYDTTRFEAALNATKYFKTATPEQKAFAKKQLPTAKAQVASEAVALRQIAKSYNYAISESELQSVLTGTPNPMTKLPMSQDELLNKMKLSAKGMFPHLSQQIDNGLSLDDIGKTYKSYAAQILEKDPNSIDMFSGPFVAAFDNGKGQQMSLTEWMSKLKSDPKYGYQHTQQANQDSTNIGLALAKAFGKVK
jgi:hypothetical protein